MRFGSVDEQTGVESLRNGIVASHRLQHEELATSAESRCYTT